MRKNRTLVLGLVLSAVLAACSSGSGASPSAAAPSVAPPAAGTAIALADSSLGKIVVDGAGKTLYLFTPDEGGTPTCYDACAQTWPPLIADGSPTAGTGLDAAKLTTVARTDGAMQVVYAGWPLYLFAADTAAGATGGQALNDKWFVVGADGAAIK